MNNNHFLGLRVIILSGLFFMPINSMNLQLEQNVITTSISDAQWGVPFLDTFEPKRAQPLILLPKTPDGSYILEEPGYYLFEAQSYCLNPGRYAPNNEIGYLYAPLKGERSDLIRNILDRSLNYPEILQEEIQTLIWAIASRSRIDYQSGELFEVARKLLTSEEILQANQGVFRELAERLWERLIDRLPPLIGEILEAEAQVRDMINNARANYADLVSVAVQEGDPPMEKGSREIPRSRWSYHPDGYFIRLIPRSFSAMLIELYVPGRFEVSFDAKRRITEVSENRIPLISSQYGEESITVKFFRFDPDQSDKMSCREWKVTDWNWERNYRNDMESLIASLCPDAQFNESVWQTSLGKKLMSLTIYFQNLESMLENNIEDLEGWEKDYLYMVQSSWAQILNQMIVQLKEKAEVLEPFPPIPSPGALLQISSSGRSFNPSGVTGAGGSTASQSVAASGRQSENYKDCTQDMIQKVDEAQNEYEACIALCLGLEETAFEICLEACEVGLKFSLDIIGEEYKACLGND